MSTVPVAPPPRTCNNEGLVLGAFAVGIVVLGESFSAVRVLAAALIVAGIIVMKASTP